MEFTMKLVFAALFLAAAVAPLAANAEERLSDARYISASRCLAYADLPQLQSDGADFTALRAAVDAGFRSSTIRSQVRQEAQRIRVNASSSANRRNSVEDLRESRDQACASFVERGLVQLNVTPSS